MKWKMNLYPEYFELIKSGKKTVEGRAMSEKRDYRKMKPNDIIIFTNTKTNEKLEVMVDRVANYPTVEEMLEKEGLKNVQPNMNSVEEGVKKYYDIEDYEERIKKDGIFALKMHLINEPVIKTIIFDIGGVFVKGSSEDFFMSACRFLGIDSVKNKIKKEFWNDLMRGSLSLKDFMRKVFGMKVSEEKIEKLIEIWLGTWKLDFEMVAFAKKLKKKYKMFILSNVDGESLKKLRHQESHLNFFDYAFNSSELGLIKPEREIYEHVLKEINAKPEECVFIDDNLENVEVARKLGINGILFENKEQLEQELEKLGVKVE